MENQKIGTLFNLALESTLKEREESMELNVGYDQEDDRWSLIIRYSGDSSGLESPDVRVVPLLGDYAVVTLPEKEIQKFTSIPEVEYVEKPKSLYFSTNMGRSVSCINTLQNQGLKLTGKGVIVGCVDSGVDYTHEDFRNPDGTSRILALWDQTVPGRPPKGYKTGTEFTREDLDQILATRPSQRQELVPSRDLSGHGTAVLGIAAGNGREGKGVYRGVAFESDLMVVKLGVPGSRSFPRTTELIQGVDYLVKKARKLGRPLALNLSFGSSYGSHSGTSLLDTYLDTAANAGRTSIC